MGKTFKFKTRMSQKGACTCGFGPFWAILGENTLLHVPFWDILVLILNETPFLGHATLCEFYDIFQIYKTVTR